MHPWLRFEPRSPLAHWVIKHWPDSNWLEHAATTPSSKVPSYCPCGATTALHFKIILMMTHFWHPACPLWPSCLWSFREQGSSSCCGCYDMWLISHNDVIDWCDLNAETTTKLGCNANQEKFPSILRNNFLYNKGMQLVFWMIFMDLRYILNTIRILKSS